jgi:chromosome segregation ATPase
MPRHRDDARIGQSDAQAAAGNFRSEMERQLLEIHEAFGAFVEDTERQRQQAEDRLREADDRLRDMKNQLREAAGQLRRLQKTPTMRFLRFFKRLNPLRSAPDRLR